MELYDISVMVTTVSHFSITRALMAAVGKDIKDITRYTYPFKTSPSEMSTISDLFESAKEANPGSRKWEYSYDTCSKDNSDNDDDSDYTDSDSDNLSDEGDVDDN